MRVFVAGGTGVIGRRLVPKLLAAGHAVIATTRSANKAQALVEMGAEAIVLDALDQQALSDAVRDAQPEAIVHLLTSIPERVDPRHVKRDFLINDRLRSEGTRTLVAAAKAAGVRRIVAQSIAFAYAPGDGSALHGERDPLYIDSPAQFRRTARAVLDLETATLGAGGVVLRFGYLYGPGTSISQDGTIAEDLRRRRMPIVGAGRGVWSFLHVEDAARAVVWALEHGSSTPYNIVDDEPAAVSEWLPVLASAVGAPRPLRIPTLLARPLAGAYGVRIMTSAQGASNELAKRELGFALEHPSWREGFRALD
jgi:nucleoside-diphosphate-sugar epimerase